MKDKLCHTCKMPIPCNCKHVAYSDTTCPEGGSCLDTKEFYEVMQIYRHTPMHDQEAVCQAFNAVKEYLKINWSEEEV